MSALVEIHEYAGFRREAPPEAEACPIWFTWSAFGARYPDTFCPGTGEPLRDLDADYSDQAGLYCPVCSPSDFFDQHWGGGYVVPTCGRCEEMLPTGTLLRFHEYEDAIWTSADCPKCMIRTWVLMRDYEALLPIDGIPEWKWPA